MGDGDMTKNYLGVEEVVEMNGFPISKLHWFRKMLGRVLVVVVVFLAVFHQRSFKKNLLGVVVVVLAAVRSESLISYFFQSICAKLLNFDE